MNNIQAKDLIQAKALGCLDPEDDTVMNRLMDEDDDFPWQELGQYQNLVAFLPTLLDIENPDQYVKDNVAEKLRQLEENRKAAEMPEPEPEQKPEIGPQPEINAEPEVEPEQESVREPEIESEIKPEVETEVKPEGEGISEEIDLTDSTEPMEPPEQIAEKNEPEEITNTDPDIKIDEPRIPEVKSITKKDISFKNYGMPHIPLSEQERQREQPPEQEREKVVEEKKVEELKPDRVSRGPAQRLSRKEFENRNVKSQVSKIPPVEEKAPVVKQKRDKLGMVMAIVLFIITLLVIAFMYFKFSKEIQQNKDEIDRLNKLIGSQEIHTDNSHRLDIT